MQLFREGENCSSIARADQVACLIDGESYFAAVRRAILKAEHSIYILGWDISSRFALLREEVDDDMPNELRDLLNAVARTRPDLNVYIVAWDYAVLLALDREWLPGYEFSWRTHKRVRFQLQEAATGASHHQKVVVIDDALAFSGGLDLTFGRWDTPNHDPNDIRRRDTGRSEIPRPYHDVQMMVSGPCAKALGDLARQRWYETTGERLPENDTIKSLWLDGIEAEFRDIDIAISQTRVAEGEYPRLRQVEQLYIDMIKAARHYIYIENQYLTADVIGNALLESLSSEIGPEIVIVTPYNTNGWLSQYTMDVLRCRMIRRLRNGDQHNRLRVYYPHLPEAGEEMALNVHAKVMVVDDIILRIGSANLNNRSMGLDSECDLSLIAQDKAGQGAVKAFRNRLLAEHLNVEQSEVAEHCEKQSSLISAIETMLDGGRSLRELETSIPEEVEQNLPDKSLIDPEAPVSTERLRDLLVPKNVRRSTASRIMIGLFVVVMILALVAMWRWTPLSKIADIETLSAAITEINDNMLAPFAAITIIALGSLVGIPLTLLIVAAMLVFGGLTGGIYGIVGALLSAIAAYVTGQYLGRDTLRRLAGARLNHISKQLAKQGILTVIVVRLVPIAPFVVVNLVAGVSHIRLRDFIIGSLLGLFPGILFLALVTEGVLHAVEQPSVYYISLVVLVLLLMAGSGLLLHRWLTKK